MNDEPKNQLDRSWMQYAACSEMDTRIFTSDRSADISMAKAICAGCSVVKICLEYALVNNEHYIWGGTTEKQRRRIRAREKLNQSLPQKISLKIHDSQDMLK